MLDQFEQEKKGHPVRMLGAPSTERQSNDWSTLALGIKTLAPQGAKTRPKRTIYCPWLSQLMLSFSVCILQMG